MKQYSKDFPREFFIQLENDEYKLGRFTLNQHDNKYSLDIDIVHSESRKIFYHVVSLYDLLDPDEAIEVGVYKLSQFLQSSR